VGTYSVWVGGGEMNANYMTRLNAEYWAQELMELGYDDVVVREEITYA
jgi:hypothetical protein